MCTIIFSEKVIIRANGSRAFFLPPVDHFMHALFKVEGRQGMRNIGCARKGFSNYNIVSAPIYLTLDLIQLGVGGEKKIKMLRVYPSSDTPDCSN